MRNRCTPSCSIHDIAESLTSDILIKFPIAVQTTLSICPDIRKNFRLDHILSANCGYFTRLNHRTAERSSKYEVRTEWYLPISPTSETVIKLDVVTDEHSASTVHNQMPRLKIPGPHSSLRYVHPTFGLHQDVFRIAQELQFHSLEGAALSLAQSMFYLADKQSPCKRIQHVIVRMRQTFPMTDASRTRIEQMADMRNKEFDNTTLPSCKISLTRRQYEQSQGTLLSGVPNGRHRVFLALGSNQGNRVEMIESAVREMGDRGLTVHRTSALYETKPMYLENQASFINGVCEVCCIHASSVEGDSNNVRLKHP